ncbi:MAG: hypothetical protein ABS70_00130 [Nitrospira sp. SCN 59-13]|nr:MAG: hypothetical protein ABS70_00130 [Nitrospira sp. SCN 59-13]
MTAAGFGILDSRKRLIVGVPRQPEVGMPLENWEVTLLARSAAEQLTVPFADFEADVLLAVGDEQDGRLLLKMLVADIRAGVADASPTVRLWAGLIVELGRQSANPYDLLTVMDLSGIHLNGLQQVLMLKHLAAEFIALSIHQASTPSVSRLTVPLSVAPRPLPVVDTRGFGRRVSSYKPGDPCGFGTDEGIATSETASFWGLGVKTVFGPLRHAAEQVALADLYRTLAETVEKLGTEAYIKRMTALREIAYSKAESDYLNKLMKQFSTAHTIATALLSLTELVAVMHAVKIEIDLEPPPPLVRTKTSAPGAHGDLTAHLSFDPGDLDLPAQQTVGCSAWALAAVGIDFSLPEKGPIKGADVQWSLIEGGFTMDSKAGYQVREAIVELENPGPRIQEAGVGFEDVKRSVRTDEQGAAKTGIHGAPQKRPLGIDPQPVIKRATVRANVQLKPADLFRDLAAALMGPWVLPAKSLFRRHLMGKNFTFTVRDWTPRLVLELRSTIIASDKKSPDPAQSEAKARIPLSSPEVAASDVIRVYKGEGMLAYRTGPPQNWNPCMALVKGEGTVGMRIFQAVVRQEPEDGTTGSGLPPQIELVYGILGESQETSTGMHTMVNYKCVPNRPERSPFWTSMFVSGRAEVSTDPMVMFLLKDWTPVGQNGVVATKTLRSTCGGQCDQEVTVFTLREDY